MRVVQIIGTLRGGGAERVAINLHKGFLKENINSEIVIFNNSKVDYDIDYKFLEKEKIVDYVKNFDLVIAHMDDSAKILQPIKKQKNVFFVVHTAIYERSKSLNIFKMIKKQNYLRKIYNNSNIITVSNGIQNDIKNLKIKYNFLKTIYNPFDFEEIKNLANEKINLDFEYIINVGSFNKIKRQDLLIKIFAKLNTNLHLVLLGKGRQEKYLKNLAKKLGVEKRVHFLGWKQNPYPYIKNAKLMVHTSKFEGFGNVLVESLILKTPVISTNYKWGVDEILDKNYIANNENELIKKIKILKNYKFQNLDKFKIKNIIKEYKGLI